MIHEQEIFLQDLKDRGQNQIAAVDLLEIHSEARSFHLVSVHFPLDSLGSDSMQLGVGFSLPFLALLKMPIK